MTNLNELTEVRLDYMKSRILELEKQNYKNRTYSPSGMVDLIKQIIMEEADKKIIKK